MIEGNVRAAALAMAIAALLVVQGSHGPASAETCAGAAVSVRGEFSRFEWSARAKARASWRRKVRLISGLGALYADWNLAREHEIRCIKSDVGVYCLMSGVPCRQ